jgi:hypothetical protein
VGTHGATLEKEADHVELAAAGSLVQRRPSPRLLLVQLPLSPLPNALLYTMNVALACEGQPRVDKVLEDPGNACRAKQGQAALTIGREVLYVDKYLRQRPRSACRPSLANARQDCGQEGRCPIKPSSQRESMASP